MNPDVVILEEALRRVSDGAMEAVLSDIVQYAAEMWGYPGTVWNARATLVGSRRYEAIDGFVRPIAKGEQQGKAPGRLSVA